MIIRDIKNPCLTIYNTVCDGILISFFGGRINKALDVKYQLAIFISDIGAEGLILVHAFHVLH